MVGILCLRLRFEQCAYEALSKLTQQSLSSAEHFFKLSMTNDEYSIIIWVMYYILEIEKTS